VYDALTIAAIVDEFNSRIVDGRIQQILQVDSLTIALEVYARRQRGWLVVSAHPEQARILLASRRVDGDAERITPLLLLLRKYARGGRVVAVSQPRHERTVQISIAKPLYPDNSDEDPATDDEHGDEPIDFALTELYVELMGRRSNIILTNSDGRILDAIKRVTPEMSRVRPIRPGADFVPPPPQDKADPLRVSAATLHDSAQASAELLPRWLVSQFQAISPVLGREVAVRAELDPGRVASSLTLDETERVQGALRATFAPLETGAWSPVVYTEESGKADFFAIRMKSREHAEGVTTTPFTSISDAAEAALAASASARPASGQRHAIRRDRLVQEIDEARTRVGSRLHSLHEQERRATEAEVWRRMGESIYVYISAIEPGQAELRTDEGLEIPLDRTLTASQNAQEYFERYRKAQSAEENLPALIDAADRELAYLDQLRSQAQISESYDEIEAVRLEWLDWTASTPGAPRAARPKGARPAATARRPREFRTEQGDRIFIGRTGPQNDAVTFDIGTPDDLWLHVRGMPGAHVILRSTGEPHEQAIERAAALAAWYSDGRESTAVPVDVTERRHVRKIKGAGPGMVTYRNEYTVNVRPRSETDLDLTQR
jgi:predicted ribosome quality control (RQC) complex YloA/Tae2 family protein